MIQTRPTAATSPRSKDPLQYTSLFMTGLRLNIPWDELLEMQLPRLTMMVDAAYGSGRKGKKQGGREVRDATQADIDAFF